MTEYEQLMQKLAGWGDKNVYSPEQAPTNQENLLKLRKQVADAAKVLDEKKRNAESYNQRKIQSNWGLTGWNKLRHFSGIRRHDEKVRKANNYYRGLKKTLDRMERSVGDARPVSNMPIGEFIEKLRKLQAPTAGAAPVVSSTGVMPVKKASLEKSAMNPGTVLQAMSRAALAHPNRLINAVTGGLKINPNAARQVAKSITPITGRENLPRLSHLLHIKKQLDPLYGTPTASSARYTNDLMANVTSPSAKKTYDALVRNAVESIERSAGQAKAYEFLKGIAGI